MPAILERAKPGRRLEGIKLGIVNNMPDAALLSTARQFLNVIDTAAPELRVFVSLYSLKDIQRSEVGRKHLVDNSYQDFSQLVAADLDAVIVTGTEPKHDDLKDEPFWPALANLLDWIDREGPPSAFSCLASHAAVLHYDGIERRPLADKCFGLFEHETLSHDDLTTALPGSFRVAHSRWNEVPAEALGECGYQILTESHDAGVELFVKERRNRLLFFQGHPEYDTQTLGREYVRDVRRYLHGERETYPNVPRFYFNATEKEMLDRFRARALNERNAVLMDHFPVLANRIAPGRSVAGAVFGAWLRQIAAAKRDAAPALAGVGYGA
jgi:homoserine O-succinyltransferase/O-acetyltransferase